MVFAQARWDEPLIIQLSHTDQELCYASNETFAPPSKIRRRTHASLPDLAEINVIQHYTRLSQQNFGVDIGTYPLGSCTMKYNLKLCDQIASSHKIQEMHPYQDPKTAQGILQIMYEASGFLADIVGVDKMTLQPAAGAHGEYTGVLLMQAYHADRNDASRDEMIIPDSAHGTNPASAAIAGYRVVQIPSRNGCVDKEALKGVVGSKTAGLMITNPNTLGLFEHDILEIADIVHDSGGLLYYDGANLNAILGKAKPGSMGFDIVHINLHKTFGTPHGGGGPGAGPVGVIKSLVDYLPVPAVEHDGREYYLNYDIPKSIGKVRAYYGSIAVILRAYVYILLHGSDGLQTVSEIAVLNSNYLAAKLSKIRGFELPYGNRIPRKHEFVISASKLFKETGVSAMHVAKRLLDLGIHPPTIYFPTIVEEAMLIEPTETVSKRDLDSIVSAFQKISDECYANSETLVTSPHSTTVTRIDEAKASRPKTMRLTWRKNGEIL
jgi:glycine dehydrogenase subunit 2